MNAYTPRRGPAHGITGGGDSITHFPIRRNADGTWTVEDRCGETGPWTYKTYKSATIRRRAMMAGGVSWQKARGLSL
jgi:hypothetical protein